jgi:hypothetical protein
MGRLRSLIIRTEIDTAQRKHRCQANAKHEIRQGDMRLNVRAGRGWDRYCMDCAKKIVDGGASALAAVSAAISNGTAIAAGDD